MPVMVVGAESGLGRAVVRALRRRGGEVRAYLDAEVAGDDDAVELRALGCKVALGEIDDEGLLETALEQVHSVVHCWGGPLTAPDVELDGVAGVLSAAIGARCRRLVWASQLGADDPRDVAYLRACAQIETLLADCDLETVVVRRALTYGEGDELTEWLAGGAAAASGARAEAVHAPLALGDLASALAAADDLPRGGTEGLSMVLSLAGPVRTTLGAVAAGLSAAGGPRRTGPLPGPTTELLSRDADPGPGVLGREGTPPPWPTG